MRLRAGAHPLLQAAVQAAGHKQWFYLIDPQGGSLTVSSTGGSGGAGGKGGRGGSGGMGGMGTPSGNNGMSGHDGLDGRAGLDGSPGRISVTYDPSAQPYLSALHVSKGASLKESPLQPLW